MSRFRSTLRMLLEHLRNAILLIVFAAIFYSLLSVRFDR